MNSFLSSSERCFVICRSSGLPAAIKFAIYFNILGIVVLAEPAERFSEDVSEGDLEAFGVSSIVNWPEEGESESGSERIEEEFL